MHLKFFIPIHEREKRKKEGTNERKKERERKLAKNERKLGNCCGVGR